MEMKAQLSPSTECEGRHPHPLKKRDVLEEAHHIHVPCNLWKHGLKSGKSQSNPLGRMHVHMACIDDVILEDDESEAALTHVPAGRDALLILAFLKDQDYGIRLSEERTAR